MLAPGSNLVLDNVRQERKNEWRTRGGNSQNALDDLPGANVPVIAAEAPWGGLVGLCRQTDNATAGRVYTPTALPRWMSPKVTFNVSGNAQQCAQTTPGIWTRRAVSPALTFVSSYSLAEGGGYRLTAWWSRAGNQGFQVSLTDAGGMTLYSSSMFGNFTTAMRPHCVYSSVANMLILVWAASAGGVVSCARWSTTTGLQVGGVTTLSTNGKVGLDLFLDAIYYGGDTITIAFRDNVATGGLRIVEYNPLTDTPTEYTPGQDAGGTLSLLPDPDASGTRYVAVTSALPEVRVVRLNAVGVIQTNHLADTVDAMNISGVAYQSTTGTPGWMIVYHTAGAPQLRAVKCRNGTTSAVVNLTPAVWGQLVELATNGWREPGTDSMRYIAYVTGSAATDTQPTYLEMALEFENGVSTISNQWTEPQARLLPLNAGAGFIERACVPQVQRTGTDRFVTCLPRVIGFDISPGQDATRYAVDAWSVQYMNAITRTGQNQGQGVQTQQCAYLPVGSLLQTATGQLLCSLGASARPFQPTLTPSNGAGSLTAGQRYAYVITTTLYDENGNSWDSDPSIQAVVSAAAMAGNNQITVVADATPFENAARLRTVKFWRTLDNGSQFFLAHEVTDTIANTTRITWLDQSGDNVLSQAISAELQSTIVPAMLHVAEFGGRLYGVERDFPTRVRYSKPIQAGASPQFPAEFVVDTDDGLGTATGLTAMDDRVVLFKGNASYVSSGAQKDNAGNGSDPVFVRISKEDGCIAGGPFMSTGAEVYMTAAGGVKRVSRSQEVDFVGAAIDQYLSMPLVTSPETVTGMVLSPAKNEVRIQTTHYRFIHDRVFNNWERDTGGFTAGTIVMTKMLGGDTQCFLTSDGHMWIEGADSAAPADAGTTYQGIIRSPWIRPTGVGGWLRLYRARAEGTVTTSSTVSGAELKIFFDDDDTVFETFTPPGNIAAAPGLLRTEGRPVRQKCQSFSLQLKLPTGDATVRLEEWWTIVGAKMGAPPPVAGTRWLGSGVAPPVPVPDILPPQTRKNWIIHPNIQNSLLGNLNSNQKDWAIRWVADLISTGQWTCVQSSTFVSMSASNLWTTLGSIARPGGSIGGYSWILLQRRDGVQIQMGITIDAGWVEYTLYMSPSGLFTGGAIAVPPTATDQVLVQDLSYGGGTNWLGREGNPAIDQLYTTHTWNSDDGTCTYTVIQGTNHTQVVLMIYRPLNPSPAWTIPVFAFIIFGGPNQNSGAPVPDMDAVMSNQMNLGQGAPGIIKADFTVEGTDSGHPAWVFANWPHVDEQSGKWLLTKTGLFGRTVGARSAGMGIVPDVWWTTKDASFHDGGTFNNGTASVIYFNQMCLPWLPSVVPLGFSPSSVGPFYGTGL